MRVKLIIRWVQFSNYRGWKLECSEEVDPGTFAKINGTAYRATRHHFTAYAPDGLDKNASVLALMHVIDGVETAHKEKLSKERRRSYFDTYQDALEYATKRIRATGQTTTRLYVDNNQWIFREYSGEIMGVIIKRNAV